jgi:hypothetical protein
VPALAAPMATVTGQHIDVATSEPRTNACQPITEYRATITPTGGGTPIVLTSATPDFDVDSVPPGDYTVTIAVTNAAGTSAESAPASATVAPLAEPTPTPTPTVSPSPSPSPTVGPVDGDGGEDDGAGAGNGGGGELAETGPTLAPLALMALGLIGAGFVLRRRKA